MACTDDSGKMHLWFNQVSLEALPFEQRPDCFVSPQPHRAQLPTFSNVESSNCWAPRGFIILFKAFLSDPVRRAYPLRTAALRTVCGTAYHSWGEARPHIVVEHI